MGPVNNAKQLRVVTDMIAEARAKGADVREYAGGEELYNGGGYFQRPALVYNPTRRCGGGGEQPGMPIMKFSTEAEVIALANDKSSGCARRSGPKTPSAVGIAKKLEAGYTYLNGHGPMAQDGRGPSAASRTPASAGIWATTVRLPSPNRTRSSAPAGFLVD